LHFVCVGAIEPYVGVAADRTTIVLARQAAFEMSAITFGSLKVAMRDGKEAKTQGFYTGAMV